jgi:hypothetical protein
LSRQLASKAYINCTLYTSILSPFYNSSTLRPYTHTRLTSSPPQKSLFTFSPLMSNKDPNKGLNAAASSYVPDSKTQNNTSSQVSLDPSPRLELRVFKLEEGHLGLSEQVDSLTELYNDLCSSVDRIKKGDWPVTVGPFQEQDHNQSHQSALAFKQELDQLSLEVYKSVDGVADVEKVNAMATPKTNGSVPPHLRAAGGASTGAGSKSTPPHLRSANGATTGAKPTSVPPHLRGKSTNG